MYTGLLRLQVCAPRVIRVTYCPSNALPKTKSLSVIAAFKPVPWQAKTTRQTVTIETGSMQAQVNRKTGAVRFLNAGGKAFLSEMPGGRIMTATTLDGPTPEAAYTAAQGFALPCR